MLHHLPVHDCSEGAAVIAARLEGRTCSGALDDLFDCSYQLLPNTCRLHHPFDSYTDQVLLASRSSC